MEKRKLALSLLSLLVMSFFCLSIVSAYDADNPYSVTMKWVIPSDTSFTVALAGAETSIDFDTNITSFTQTEVEPDSQDAAGSVPIATVTNTGNQNLNFSCNLSASKPSYAVLKIGDTNVYASADTVDTAETTFATNVASSASTDMYAWTDLTDATPGTEERTFYIYSIASS